MLNIKALRSSLGALRDTHTGPVSDECLGTHVPCVTVYTQCVLQAALCASVINSLRGCMRFHNLTSTLAYATLVLDFRTAINTLTCVA